MTSNVVLFLGQLTDLSDTVGPLLAQDQSYSNALVHTQPWPKPQRNRALLGLYISIYAIQFTIKEKKTKLVSFWRKSFGPT